MLNSCDFLIVANIELLFVSQKHNKIKIVDWE